MKSTPIFAPCVGTKSLNLFAEFVFGLPWVGLGWVGLSERGLDAYNLDMFE